MTEPPAPVGPGGTVDEILTAPLLPPLRRDALTPLRAYAQLRVLLAHRASVRATEATLLGALRGCVRQLDRVDEAIAQLEQQAHEAADEAP